MNVLQHFGIGSILYQKHSLYKKLSDLMGGTQKISKRRLRKIFGWNFNDAMSQALTLMDPATFAKSVEIIPKKAK